ncbi:MAG TPA: hypothetical protein DER05_02740 [Lutibacter sp.]|nr:hypothetical protein [Lutibacter sp.]
MFLDFQTQSTNKQLFWAFPASWRVVLSVLSFFHCISKKYKFILSGAKGLLSLTQIELLFIIIISYQKKENNYKFINKNEN